MSKVGDTITATVDPASADVEFEWFALASADSDTSDAVSVGEGSSLEVTTSMVDKFLMVVATDDEGNTDEAVTSAPVKADASEDVSIIDKMGLQSDGTGIVGDTLAISYGVTFGTPTAVTWYKNGSVVRASGSANDPLALELPIRATLGTGTYMATVVADGLTYTTNEIIITNKEEQAEILAYTIEDDYTDGKAITYGTDDDTAIVTVTLSKNYDGKFELYKANDSKFGTPINDFTTSVGTATTEVKDHITAAAGGATGATAPGTNQSVLTTDAATNFQAANMVGGGDQALGHINADGTVTYKWMATAGKLTRGEDYKITFNQNSILTDTPGQGNENVFETPATVPYVTAPAQIAVTKVAANNKPEVTFQDEDGEPLKWFGEATNNLSTSGIKKGDVYYATEKTNDVTKAKGLKSTLNATNVKKGVWTSNVPAGTDAFWFAEVETTKGIFAKESTKLTSDAVQIAKDGADMINLTEKGTTSVEDAKTAKIAFKNLRCAGKVYIVRGKAGDTTAAQLYSYFTSDTTAQIVGSADVEAGDSSVEVPNVIEPYSATAGENRYIAVFVPTDDDNYGSLYTKDGLDNTWKLNDDDAVPATKADNQGLTVKQTAVTLDWNKDTKGKATVAASAGNKTITLSGTTLKAKDQFGEAMTTPENTSDPVLMTAIDKTLTTTEKGTFVYETGATGTGLVTATLTVNAGAIDNKDGFKFTLLGTEVEITRTRVTTGNATLANDTPAAAGDSAELTVKIGGNVFCDNTTAIATEKATELTGLEALTFTLDNAASGTTATVTVDGTVGTVAATGLTLTTTDADDTWTVAGRTCTMTSDDDATNSGTCSVTVTGDYYKRVVSYSITITTGQTNNVTLTKTGDAITEV